jgi:hypothetical protein
MYVFYASGGWLQSPDLWREGMPVRSRGGAPGGLQAPVRGFGYIWGERDEVFQGLGWARDSEKGFCALIQEFEHGFIARASPVGSCWNGLYNHAAQPGFSFPVIRATYTGNWR